jgi:hypothetical protein
MKYQASKIDDIEIDGIDTKDYPDFCDAYILRCVYDGRELTDEELDELQNQRPDLVYEYVLDELI